MGTPNSSVSVSGPIGFACAAWRRMSSLKCPTPRLSMTSARTGGNAQPRTARQQAEDDLLEASWRWPGRI
eukprot:4367402-Pyramimonas_sp.AAC.1